MLILFLPPQYTAVKPEFKGQQAISERVHMVGKEEEKSQETKSLDRDLNPAERSTH